MENTVKLSELLSVCVQLAEDAGRIMRDVYHSNDMKEVNKSDVKHDPVTIADLTIQKTIEHNLNVLYPGMKIVGEEDSSM
jgi:3'-phosphoadenosine 5'-phosphosulfate (PAPS) 3'-phosphatase